jgi:hypothetical protein
LQGGDVEQEHGRDREHAERSDVALLHDPQLGLAVPAAAEAVGGVGQSVEMQAAGQHHQDDDAEDRRQQWRVGLQPVDAVDDDCGDRAQYQADQGCQRHRPAGDSPVHCPRYAGGQHRQRAERELQRIEHDPSVLRARRCVPRRTTTPTPIVWRE